MRKLHVTTLAEAAVPNVLASDGVSDPGRLDRVKASKVAADAVAIATCLAISAARSDGDWSQVAYAAYWRMSERTAQREWQLFKRAFPHEDSPERIARAIAAHYVAEMGSLRPEAALSVPADVLAG